MKYRDSQKRFIEDYYIYFVTANTNRRYPYFKEDLFCEVFIDNLRICKKLKGFKLFAFTINYDHVHLLLMGNDEYNISQIMFSIKKQFSHNINKVIGYNKFIAFESGQAIARFQKKMDGAQEERDRNQEKRDGTPGNGDIERINFEGGQSFGRPQRQTLKSDLENFEIRLKQYHQKFILQYGLKHNLPKFQWQPSFHDHTIRLDNKDDFKNHVHYIISNCVKHSIASDYTKYKWSSIIEEFKDLIDEFYI